MGKCTASLVCPGRAVRPGVPVLGVPDMLEPCVTRTCQTCTEKTQAYWARRRTACADHPVGPRGKLYCQ